MTDKFKEGRFTQKDSSIIFYAFRYCLGRMSYAVGEFCEYATAYIRQHDLELMEKEITDADEKDKEDATTTRFCSRLGWDCDRADWLRLRDAIREELKRRGVAK